MTASSLHFKEIAESAGKTLNDSFIADLLLTDDAFWIFKVLVWLLCIIRAKVICHLSAVLYYYEMDQNRMVALHSFSPCTEITVN